MEDKNTPLHQYQNVGPTMEGPYDSILPPTEGSYYRIITPTENIYDYTYPPTNDLVAPHSNPLSETPYLDLCEIRRNGKASFGKKWVTADESKESVTPDHINRNETNKLGKGANMRRTRMRRLFVVCLILVVLVAIIVPTVVLFAFQDDDQDDATTTRAPGTPWINCLSPIQYAGQGDTVEFICELQDIGIVTSIRTISGDGSKIYTNTADQGIVGTINLHAGVTMTIDVDAGQLIVNFTNVVCALEGSYITRINSVTEDEITLRIVSDPVKPSLNVPSAIYNNQLMPISCSGKVGRNKEGKPTTRLIMEVQHEDATVFTTITEGLTTEPISELNCTLTETIHLNVKAATVWNNTNIRCVLKNDNDIIVGSTEENRTHILESDVNFVETTITAYIGDSVTVGCNVKNINGLSKVRLTRGADNVEVSMTSNAGSTDFITGISTVANNSYLGTTGGAISIRISPAECGDKGDYFCQAVGTNVSVEAKATLSLKRHPEAPSLDLSIDIIENKGQWPEFPTTCVAEVGDPAGTIVLESNLGGYFHELNSTFITVTHETNEEECSTTATIKYLNDKPYNMDWDGTLLRCRVRDDTSDTDGSFAVTKVVHIVPVSTCNGKQNYIKLEHPFACFGLITCTTNAYVISPYQACSHKQCWSGGTCVSCETVGKCITDYILTTTTTTTTTTLAPGTPSIQCSEVTTTVGNSASSICTLNNININVSQDSIQISHDQDTVFDIHATGSGGGIAEAGVSFDFMPNATVVIGDNTISVKFVPIICNHAGVYSVHYSSGSTDLRESFEVNIYTDATSPVLSKSTAVYYLDQYIDITCNGNLGRPKGSTDMVLKKKTAGSDVYNTIDQITSRDVANELCATNKTITYTYTESHAGDVFMCETTTTVGNILVSATDTVVVEEPAIYFNEQQKSVPIGQGTHLVCTLNDFNGATAVVISRQTISSGVLEDVKRTNITSDNSPTVLTLTIDAVACADEGDYFCDAVFAPGSDTSESLKTRSFLSVTSSPEIQNLQLPNKLVAGENTAYGSDYLNCTADVGQPPGYVRLVYSLKNSTEFKNFANESLGTAATTETPGNCSTIKSEYYQEILFTQDWNNRRFRCDVFNESGILHSSSAEQTLQLVENTCEEDGDGYYYHPYNCHSYKWCYGNGILAMNSCKTDCPNILGKTWGGCVDVCNSLCLPQ